MCRTSGSGSAHPLVWRHTPAASHPVWGIFSVRAREHTHTNTHKHGACLLTKGRFPENAPSWLAVRGSVKQARHFVGRHLASRWTYLRRDEMVARGGLMEAVSLADNRCPSCWTVETAPFLETRQWPENGPKAPPCGRFFTLSLLLLLCGVFNFVNKYVHTLCAAAS